MWPAHSTTAIPPLPIAVVKQPCGSLSRVWGASKGEGGPGSPRSTLNFRPRPTLHYPWPHIWPIPGLPGSLHLLRYSLLAFNPARSHSLGSTCCIMPFWTWYGPFLPCHVSQPLVCFPPQKVSQPCSLPSSITSCFTYLFQRLPFWKRVQLMRCVAFLQKPLHTIRETGTISPLPNLENHAILREWQLGPKWCNMASIKRRHIISVGHSFTKTIFVKLFRNVSQ